MIRKFWGWTDFKIKFLHKRRFIMLYFPNKRILSTLMKGIFWNFLYIYNWRYASINFFILNCKIFYINNFINILYRSILVNFFLEIVSQRFFSFLQRNPDLVDFANICFCLLHLIRNSLKFTCK